MMINAEIRKGKGIEELLAGYGGQAETERKIKTESNPWLEEVLNRYLKVLEFQWIGDDHEHPDEPLMTRGLTLTPIQINTFLQATIPYENHDTYLENTGYFLSRLIQNSYDAGHNQFHLNTTNLKEIDWLAAFIQGNNETPIEITITGNTGYYCGAKAKNSTYHITGNTKDRCGLTAKHSTFHIKGNTEDNCGQGAENSTFNIQGNAGKYCGECAENSTFSTTNKETLKQLEKYVPSRTCLRKHSFNKVIFIDECGMEHVVRDYSKRGIYPKAL